MTAKELPDGAVPPVDVEGNFIIGPTHAPAPEMTASPPTPTLAPEMDLAIETPEISEALPIEPGPIETPARDYPVEEFRGILELNVIGTFLPCKHAIPHLIARGGGRIINIAGTSGLRGYRNRSGYSSSKWAIRGFTRTLALELGPHDITVNDVCPNVTNGARMDKIVAEKARVLGKTPEEVYADFERQTALGRFVEEEDIANAIDFLVSDGARNITGHDIPVDAGWDV